MSDQDLSAALVAIAVRQQSLDKDKIEQLKGERGPRGERGEPGQSIKGDPGKDGRDGRDGKDAPPVEIIVGDVSVGDKAAAHFTRDPNGVFILNLVLPRAERGPRGEKGEASQVPGPQGIPGRDGADSKVAGPPGRDGADSQIPGPRGEKGEAGMSAEEIAKLVISVLSDAGVLSAQAQTLVAVRTKLKRAIHEVDARHQSQIRAFVAEVDKLF